MKRTKHSSLRERERDRGVLPDMKRTKHRSLRERERDREKEREVLPDMKSGLEPLPPGSSDLVVWDGLLDLQRGPWSELPAHLLHLVLAWLPFQSIFRFRCVCRDWKALLASPSFHHFPSHAPHVPAWIFFLGTGGKFLRTARDDDDDGSDDEEIDFECFSFSGDEDDFSDSLLRRVCVDPGNAQESVLHDECGDIYGAMHDGVRSCDHVCTQNAIAKENTDMNDPQAIEELLLIFDTENTNMKDPQKIEELLLIFDTASKSWRTPLVMPTRLKIREGSDPYSASVVVCSSREHVLIASCSVGMNRFFLFNPGVSIFKELPPCIGSQSMGGVGFTVEMASDIPSFSKCSMEQSVEATTNKIMQVVVIGNCCDGMYVVEKFSFNTGSWHICGYLRFPNGLHFEHRRMMFYKGSFYGITGKRIMKLDIAQEDQSIKYTFRDVPIRPVDYEKFFLLVAIDSLYMVGVIYRDDYVDWEWSILVWEYLPHAADNACWNFQSYMPQPLLEKYFGDSPDSRACDVNCLAHGDLMFFGLPNRRHFLIYELCTKVWRFSKQSRWPLGDMSFVWEPLLRN